MIPKNLERIGTWPNSNYFNSLTFTGDKKEFYKKNFNFDFDVGYFAIINDDFFYPKNKFEELCEAIRPQLPEFLEFWNNKCLLALEQLKEFVNNNRHKDHTKLSDKELSNKLKEANQKLIHVLSFLMNYLHTATEIEDYVVKNVKDIKFEEVRPLYRVSYEKLNDMLMDAKSEESFRKIEKEFAWYGVQLLRGKSLSVKDFKEMKKNAKPSEFIKVSDNPLIRELQLFTFLKFERIDACNYAFHHMHSLFREVFKRINLDIRYWDVLLFEELEDALKNKRKFNEKELDLRFEQRGVIKDGENIRISTEEEWNYFKKLANTIKSQEELKGKVSCKGLAKGKARIILKHEDINKVKERDILVAFETIVQYEPFLRKSSGMVIEMGGLLSHAAIFSREFNIPTVVGVKDATRIIKDGDLVEVDANKGIIKILKRAESK